MALITPPTSRNAFRVAIICALPLEAEMVQAAFDRNWTHEGHKFRKAGGDTNAYTTGLIGEHNVVLAHMAKMGNSSAATTASALRLTFRRLEMIFLVGICGAVSTHPETKEEVILGDCILSTAVIQYDYGRQFDNAFVRKKGHEENLSKANPEIQAILARLKVLQNRAELAKRLTFHLDQLQQTQRFEYPGPESDNLFSASYPHKHHNGNITCRKCYEDADSCSLDCLTLQCDPLHLLERNRLKYKVSMPKPPPYIHLGRIGSADSILRSASLRDKLAETDQIVGFEMECAGVWEVLPTILIKSVCDYADSHKNKNWQPYAAASAAACLKAFFEQWEASEPSPITPTTDVPWAPHNYAGRKQGNGFQYPLDLVGQSNDLASRLKSINEVLKTPPYEDPLTHNSSLCLEGTATWIFGKEIYKEWLHFNSPSTTSFLWLYAGAGFGKTILCTSIVNSLKLNPTLNVFHYFSSAHLGSNTDLSNIVRYWISEMARYDSPTTNTSMLTLIETALHKYGVGKTVASADAWNMFGSLVSHFPNSVFILDGLDEYDRSAREQLLTSLKSQLAGKGVKVLITSRDESDIRTELSTRPMGYPGLSFCSLGITKNDTRSDISLLAGSLITRKLRGKDAASESELTTTLSNRCDGMFLWVRLASQNLHAGQTPATLKRIVDRAPSGINSLYTEKWRSIMEHPEPEERHRNVAVLRWCTYAMVSLTVSQLAEAIAVNLDDPNDDFNSDELPAEIDEDFVIQGIKGLCGSFVELRSRNVDQPLSEQTLHLIHASVKDFLLAELPKARVQKVSVITILPSDSVEHLELSKICLRHLCYKNITPYVYWNKLGRYAIQYWASHQAKSGLEDKEFVQLILRFLTSDNRNFFYWKIFSDQSLDSIVDYEGCTDSESLYFAAQLGLVLLMKEIYSQMTVSIDSIGGYYGTALQAACASGHKEAFGLLLSWKADINMTGGYYGSALATSAAFNHFELTKDLLARGADPNRCGKEAYPAIYYAIEHNEIDCVATLLANGANSKTKTPHGDMPLHLAIRSNTSQEMVELLLEHSALDPLDYVNPVGRTLLQEAAFESKVEVFNHLIAKGFDPYQRDKHGNGVLEACSASRSTELLDRLLQKSTSALRNPDKPAIWSLLHWACYRGSFKVVQRLVSAGYTISSIVTSTPEATWTPLDIARFYSNTEFFENGKLIQNRQWETILGSGLVTFNESSGLFEAASGNSLVPYQQHSLCICDSCQSPIPGPLFHNLTLHDFDYCIMCKHTADVNGLHPGERWEYIEW